MTATRRALLRGAVNRYADSDSGWTPRGRGSSSRDSSSLAASPMRSRSPGERSRSSTRSAPSREADEASSLLRGLGVKTRSGPRAVGLLTRRELDVLRLLAEGLTNAEIAQRLFISPKTVEHHVGRIYRKLDVKTRSEAAAYAARHLGSE